MKACELILLKNSISGELQKRFNFEYIEKAFSIDQIDSKFIENEEFMLKSIKKRKWLMTIPLKLWETRSFILKAVKLSSKSLKRAKIIDTEIISQSLESKPNSLQHCKKDIRNNKEMVLKALGKTYGTLMFVGESIIDDVDVLRKCLSESKSLKTLKYSMSKTELMKEIVRRYPLSIFRFYKWLKDEIDFEQKPTGNVLIRSKSVLEIDGKLYSYPNYFLKYIEDSQVAIKIIQVLPQTYRLFKKTIRVQDEVIIAALSGKIEIVNVPHNVSVDILYRIYAEGLSSLSTDRIACELHFNNNVLTNYLLEKYFKAQPNFLPFFMCQHRDLCKLAIQIHPRNFLRFSDLLTDEELSFQAFQSDPSIISFLDPGNNFIIKCYSENKRVLEYLKDGSKRKLLQSPEHIQILFNDDRTSIERLLNSVYPSNVVLENIISLDPNLFTLFPTMQNRRTLSRNELTKFAQLAIEKGLNIESNNFKELELSKWKEITDFIENRLNNK